MNHREAWDLIPWLVNDSLDATQREHLERHLDECADCRGELHTQRELKQAMNSGTLVEAMPRASLQRLWERIDADSLQSREAATSAAPAPAPVARRFVAAAACIGLVAGAALTATFASWSDESPAGFRTVTDEAPVVANGAIRAVFAGELTLTELQSLLRDAQLQAVAGPTQGGVYTLLPATPRDTGAALAVLRAHPAVRFAEPAAK